MSGRWPALALAVALAPAAGCREAGDPDAGTPVAPGAAEARPTASDLVPLRIRRLPRGDRLPATAGRSEQTSLPSREAPQQDSWDSERLSDLGLQLLRRYVDGERSVLAEGFVENPAQLHPDWLRTGRLRWRAEIRPRAVAATGRGDRAQSLNLDAGAKLKVVGFSSTEAGFDLAIRSEHRREGRFAVARWLASFVGGGDDWRLARLVARAGEESAIEGGALFAEATAAVLAGDALAVAQQGRGIADWAGEVTRFGDLALTGHHGIAVADVDGDGREDLFVADGGSLPNRLYLQRDDGTLRDVSERAGLDWYEDTRAALLTDLDNDGDPDLVAATVAMIAVAENDGTGVFTLRGGFPGAQYPFGLSAADYDLDGDLDLYVCLYGEGDDASGGRGFDSRSPVPFHDAKNGGRNVLLENRGGFRFADVTESVGLGHHNDRWSFAAAWEDYDLDGDPDLYVANDFGKNCLYRNDGGSFVEIAAQAGCEDVAAGMSVAWGDYDRDGRPDLYVGNMYSAAGSRLAGLARFAPAGDRGALQRMAAGNSLFAGGDDGFREIEGAAGAAMGRWAWSSGFADLDNDGWEDLVVANGYLSGFATPDDW